MKKLTMLLAALLLSGCTTLVDNWNDDTIATYKGRQVVDEVVYCTYQNGFDTIYVPATVNSCPLTVEVE